MIVYMCGVMHFAELPLLCAAMHGYTVLWCKKKESVHVQQGWSDYFDRCWPACTSHLLTVTLPPSEIHHVLKLPATGM
jgi:hypothetical protein